MDFKSKVMAHLGSYKRDVLGSWQDGCFGGREYSHILCDSEREKNLSLIPNDAYEIEGSVLKFAKIEHAPIKLHTNWHHLNSSQILCVSYFYKFMENSDLLRAFCEHYGLDEPSCAELEYVTGDSTNVDFTIHLKNGGHIFFEVKYTEQCFGGVSLERKSRSRDEVTEIYQKRYEKYYKSVKISEENYLKHYQVVRNISLSPIESSNTTIFLIPRGNESICRSLESGLCSIENRERFRAITIYWEELLTGAFGDTAVLQKYFDFDKK